MPGSPGAPGTPRVAGAMTTIHRYALPLGCDEVWALISDVRNYRRWWSWLRVFEATSLEAGDEWHCEVQPPVPYPVRFDVALELVRAPSFVQARVGGDVEGRATLTLEAAGDTAPGSVATLRSSLAPGNPALRLVARVAFPVARFGHDWVMDAGARQFIARVTRTTSGDGAGPAAA
ncbi:MAG TPA: SRPBCC family protein [Acidimicrobiales bacterium]|nr:SRPBCC family protein [Acidimicrobiales bacterium]